MAQAARTPRSLKVCTFNLRIDVAQDGEHRWPHRRDRVAEWVLNTRPDVVGFQEVYPNQRADLEQRLGAVYGSAGRHALVDGSGCSDPVFYRRDRFTLEESRTRWLSDQPDVPGSASYPDLAADDPISEPRVFTWARLRESDGSGRVLNVINSHFDHKSRGGRAQAADQIVREVARLDGPAIFFGDLNSEENSPGVRLLSTEMLNCYRVAHPTGEAEATFHDWNVPGAPDAHIDYIFAPRTSRVKSCQVVLTPGARLSDHFPLVAEIEL